MVVFNWLHLTDLHLGMKGSQDLWPYVEEDFFNDLKKLVKDERGPQVDPLDFVVFTGDLVQSGRSEEFEEVDVVLAKLWRRFDEEMGFEPKLLVVPGNHDLTRPPESTGENPNPALDTLTHLWHLSHVYDAFWDPRSPQREVVNRAFTNYVDWWQHTPIPKPEVSWKGELPGDFSATIEKDGAKLGIVGLNSTFLQLTAGDLEGMLALSARQFNLACGGHGPDWAAAHNLCLLLTHHPPQWLTEASRRKLVEIHKPPRFALHMFGHVHEADLTDLGQGGTQPLRRLQGNSLFSLEKLSSEASSRRHGYSLGQLKVAKRDSEYAELRIWPRSAEQLPGGRWSFGQDRRFGDLEMDNATAPFSVSFRPRVGIYTYPEDQRSDADEEPVIESATTDKEKRFQSIDPAIAAADPVLIARLDVLQQKLARIPRWLQSDLEKLGVEKSFKKTLLDENIGQPLNRQENSLGDIYRNLKRLDPENEEAVSEALKDAWSSYQTVYRESQEIFRDCLELMGGLALRDKELDERICEVADELINATTDYVRTSWYSFTILAQREAFQWTISRIIRLRFPEWTIWSLPFAAHEFGHVVIRDKDMFKNLVKDHANEWKKGHLHVILADAFATYVMGPAYVCAAISLWLNPSEPADEAAFSEPSDDVDPDYASALGIRGAVLYALERNEEALRALDQALTLDPDYAFALATKGLVLRALDRDQEAAQVLGRAAELDPDLTGAQAELGEALRMLGRNEEVMEALDRALATGALAPRLPDSTRARVMFAVLNRMNDMAYDDFGKEPYKEITDLLTQRWEAALRQQEEASGQQLEEIRARDNQKLEELVDRALRELDDWLYEDGMYPHRGENGIEVAEAWAREWEEQLSNAGRLSIPELSQKSTLRDAMNAAWLCRIRGEPDQVDLVAKAAYQLCEEIIEQKAVDAGGPVTKRTRLSARGQVASRRQAG